MRIQQLTFLLYFVFSFFSCNENSAGRIKDRVRSDDFSELHQVVLANQFKNLALLPEPNFIVVDGLVIDRVNQTFGREEDIIGFYADYYRIAKTTPFHSADSLFKAHNIAISEKSAKQILVMMKGLAIADIKKIRRTYILRLECLCYVGI